MSKDQTVPLGQLPCDTACPGGHYDKCSDGNLPGAAGVKGICLCKGPCPTSVCWNPAVKIDKRTPLLDQRAAWDSRENVADT